MEGWSLRSRRYGEKKVYEACSGGTVSIPHIDSPWTDAIRLGITGRRGQLHANHALQRRPIHGLRTIQEALYAQRNSAAGDTPATLRWRSGRHLQRVRDIPARPRPKPPEHHLCEYRDCISPQQRIRVSYAAAFAGSQDGRHGHDGADMEGGRRSERTVQGHWADSCGRRPLCGPQLHILVRPAAVCE